MNFFLRNLTRVAFFFFFQAEDGIRDVAVTGVQTCALPIYIADRVANLGSNVFLLTRFPLITDVEEYVKANRRNKKVTWDDYEALRENLKLPLRVGVELRTDGKVRRGTESITDVNIRGVTANMGDIDPVTPRDGRSEEHTSELQSRL